MDSAGYSLSQMGCQIFSFSICQSATQLTIGASKRYRYGKFSILGNCKKEQRVTSFSCPNLQALCLSWCWSVTERGLIRIVERLGYGRLLIRFHSAMLLQTVHLSLFSP